MCTALTLTTGDHRHLFGRTMDIPAPFGQRAVTVPRRYTWENRVTGGRLSISYAVTGMAAVADGHPLFADAINEQGLCGAGLNFAGFDGFAEAPAKDRFNLGTYDLLLWALGSFDSLDALRRELPGICLLNRPYTPGGPISHLHWMFSDRTGKSIVLECVPGAMHIYDNPAGVLTNCPDFPWHLKNLHQYMGISPIEPANTAWSDLELYPYGMGAGLWGLPGDFTPASRFVRAAYYRNYIQEIGNEAEGVNGMFHIFNTCEIPKGSVMTRDSARDYTLYTSVMCGESGTYRWHTYERREVRTVRMSRMDLRGNAVMYH